jgi:hypothetical protein
VSPGLHLGVEVASAELEGVRALLALLLPSQHTHPHTDCQLLQALLLLTSSHLRHTSHRHLSNPCSRDPTQRILILPRLTLS